MAVGFWLNFLSLALVPDGFRSLCLQKSELEAKNEIAKQYTATSSNRKSNATQKIFHRDETERNHDSQ